MNEKDYIIIPNPLYDVVFKYLMEDYESAKIILETLTGEKIIKLEFTPLSHSEKISTQDAEKDVRLFHLDFTATIALPDDKEELVMIELQKANIPSDIFRFKRYISHNFKQKQKKEVINPETKEIVSKDFPIRLLPIFILNFRIENEINDLMIKVKRNKYGIFSEKSLTQNSEFIDHLTYDMYIVQLPNIHNFTLKDLEKNEYKQKLYTLLKLFDQQAQLEKNKHRIRVFKKLFPGQLERIVSRLKAADASNPDLEEQMHAEDEFLELLNEKNNEIAFFKNALKKEKQKAEQERQKAEQERQKVKNSNIKLAKKMLKYGEKIEDILKETGLSEIEIKKLS